MPRRTHLLATTTLLSLGLLASPAAAAPAVPGPPSHQHTLTVPGTGQVVDVGPPVCRVAAADRGARNFHLRVHSVMAGAAPVTQAGLDIGFAEGGPWCPAG